jgi:hypothetical protein
VVLVLDGLAAMAGAANVKQARTTAPVVRKEPFKL